MQTVREERFEEEFECLPWVAWLFLGVALIPHFLGLVGLDLMAVIAALFCFPVSMEPFGLVHAFFLINRLGFASHMAWISAVIFSMAWFATVCWLRRKYRST